jgi:prepilin-type N-terminal cleavage/methylation domain-containing protein
MKYTKNKDGFSMIELLTAVAIIAVLILTFMFLLRNQKVKGNDARRKADLENIKIYFEDYFNDNDCYPADTILDVCGDESFQPYLKEIPCDPMSGEAYAYEPVSSCGGYRAYAVLENTDDPVIAKLGCDGVGGCGAASGEEFNYGISVGVGLYGGGAVVLPSPSPSPGWIYACDSSGVCNQFLEGHPLLATCPITFVETDCQSSCASVANRCSGF